ncbi:acyl-CoA dehydrogenase C-terminal domain-containing protein [Amorphus sp. MBR-141]
MPSYKAPVADALFLANDVFRLADHADLAGFEDVGGDTLGAILDEAAKLAEEVMAPLNRTGDVEGCTRRQDGSVETPDGFKEAYARFAEGGWIGLAGDPTYGGQGLPFVVAALANEFFSSANMALAMYPGLTQGAITAITLHGSDAQKELYLPKLMSGEWSGTMNLTEPQCGTDLGLVRTKAVPAGDGSYRISGTKIFISAGEHDLTDNIVHLVLARIEGAPEGTKGISLFVVPKVLPDGDGLGAANGVSCGSIESKMGIHGNATCTMIYEDAVGWLVSEENKGLRAMFTMMNEARVGVGVQGLALGEVAAQNAGAYARDRRQGRALSGAAEPQAPADPIIVHPDIRRTLMRAKAFTEGARAFVMWVALASDIAHRSADAAARQAADDRLALLTPILKAVLTDQGFETAVASQQVYGGHGYIAETGVEQFVRDARIAMIYEGANGIQALDLVGRKLPRDGGRAVTAFLGEARQLVADCEGEAELADLAAGLAKGLDDLQGATMWFVGNALAKPDNAGAGATDYLHLFGLVVFGTLWLRMARAAQARRAAGTATPAIDGKLATARFFMQHMLPETALRRARVEAGAGIVMALPADAF